MSARLAIAALLASVLLFAAFTCGTNQIDHYRGYPVSSFLGSAPPTGVTLRDAFLSSVVDPGGPVLFMPPVNKNEEGIIRRIPHLTCYAVAEPFQARVRIRNQFGSQVIDVGDSEMLCVPTEKFPQDPPRNLNIDHFRCYKAAGDSLDEVVSLEDQFQLQTAVEVLEPVLFCLPVDKNGEGIRRRNKHLTCYATQPPGMAPPIRLPIRNQFHEAALRVTEPDVLCVPSRTLAVSLPCGDSFAPECGGLCPAATDECRPVPGPGGDVCGCVEPPVPCQNSDTSLAAPQCNGSCPDLNQLCVPDASGSCGCVIRCGGFAGFQCPAGATCVDLPGDQCGPQCGADCGGFCVEIEPVFCGGIAGIPCPTGLSCIDNPSDHCDPDCGAADCGGLCGVDTGTFCGGIAGFPCPDGFECVDAKGDSCSPVCGGADCGGTCVRFGPPRCGGFAGLTCPLGLTCVDDPSDTCDPDCGAADCGGICVTPAG